MCDACACFFSWETWREYFKAVGWGYYGTELEVCDAEFDMNIKET